MKLVLTPAVDKRIDALLHTSYLGDIIGDELIEPVADVVSCSDPARLEEEAERFLQKQRLAGNEITADRALIEVMVRALLSSTVPYVGKPFPYEYLPKILDMSKVYHAGEMESDIFLRTTRLPHARVGNFRLFRSVYKKYDLFQYDEQKLHNGVLLPCLAVFDYNFYYPIITENGETWMSITPNEITSMAKPIEEARGQVLTLGCGIGYFAVAASAKPEVEHVTIIENSPDMITLFTQHILPLIPWHDKISVIQADAFDYMLHLRDGCFDYCFADIWKDFNDHLPFLRMKRMARKFRKMKMAYWLDDSISSALTLHVIIELARERMLLRHQKLPEVPTHSTAERIAESWIHSILRHVTIRTPEDIDYYVDYQHLQALMR